MIVMSSLSLVLILILMNRPDPYLALFNTLLAKIYFIPNLSGNKMHHCPLNAHESHFLVTRHT